LSSLEDGFEEDTGGSGSFMDFYTVLIFVHVVLFAGWLGGHLGVLALLRQARSAKLDPEHRGFTLRLAMRLDRIPRTAFALTPAVGLTLAQSWGSPVRDGWLLAVWAITLVWVFFVWAVPRESETEQAQTLRKIEGTLMVLGGLAFLVYGAYELFWGMGLTGKWLALKMAIFGLVPVTMLEIGEGMHRLRPALDELSATRKPVPVEIARAIDVASAASLILYALLIAIAFIGATKPI
jgi:uncharacterized membrane protein